MKRPVRTCVALAAAAWTLVTLGTVPAAAGPASAAAAENGLFDGVTCLSASNCFAVGESTVTGTSGDHALIEHWNGTRWAVESVAAPKPSSFPQLLAVACSSVHSCFAVGDYSLSSTRSAPLAEHWNGSTWTAQYLPEPPRGSDGSLAAIACPGRHICVAVGSYETQGGNVQNLADSWNGTKWTFAVPTGSNGELNELSGVACTSDASCTAVGRDGAVQVTFAGHWNGRTWAVQKTPNPAGMQTPGLSGVSCHTYAMCMAVGTSNVGVETETLAERWQGSRWSIVPSKNPSTATHPDSYLVGVSCPSATRCVSVGEKAVTVTREAPMAELWNGSRWSTMSVPDSPATGNDNLAAVACTGSSACVAVGYSVTSEETGAGSTLAESWNGSRWMVVATPAP